MKLTLMQGGLVKHEIAGVQSVRVLGDVLVAEGRGVARKWGAPGPHWLSPEGVTYDGFDVEPDETT